MAFSEIKAAAKPGRVSVACNRVGGSSRLRLLVSISANVAAQLGIEAGNRFRMYRGHAESDGILRIEPDKAGEFQFNRGSHGVVRAVMDCPDVLPDGPRKSQPASFRQDDDGAFDIEMPDWFGQGGNHGNEEQSRAV